MFFSVPFLCIIKEKGAMYMYQSIKVIEKLLKPLNKQLTNIQYDGNEEYEGCLFEINQHTFRSRLAKKTPKKKGYFVACWYKDEENQPFALEETPDKVIVSILDERAGQFIFPKEVLAQKGILKTATSKGKMAFRVYPTWETELNATAQKTQKWQQEYFMEISADLDNQSIAMCYF